MKIFLKSNLIFFAFITLLSSCKNEQTYNFQGTGFGSYYSITYVGKENHKLQQQVDSIIADLNHQLSLFDTTSILYRINQGENLPYTEDMIKMFEISQKIASNTNGAYDITVTPLINLWGFGKDKKSTIEKSKIDSILQIVGFTKLKLVNNTIIKEDPRIQINFNAIADGYASDKIAHFLEKQGYPNCIVDVGGEIVALGTKGGKQWQVGIQTPTEDADGAIDAQFTFPIKNKAISTSGNYRKYTELDGQRYSHIINPKTGQPEHSSLLSVTVIADDCATADAYSTAFMVLSMEKTMEIVKKNPKIGVYFIYDEKGKFKVKKSPNFP
ncbi:MAG: ApbE family protein [Bacteroidetes bacterium]|nr:ApbE family protein [Bacteroidota bacterium]